MKNIICLLAGLLAVSCTQADLFEEPSSKDGSSIEYSILANTPEFLDTKSSASPAIRIAWHSGDIVYVIDLESKCCLGQLSIAEPSAISKLTGTLTIPEGVAPGVLGFIHSNRPGFSMTTGQVYTDGLSISMNGQAASSANDITYVLYATQAYSPEGFQSKVVNFDFATSIIYDAISISGITAATPVTMASIKNIGTECVLAFSEGEIDVVEQEATGILHASVSKSTNDEGEIGLFFSVPASKAATRTISVTAGTKTYSDQYSSNKFQKSYFYTHIGSKMEVAPVAQVAESTYPTLASALSAATSTETNQTVKLLADIEEAIILGEPQAATKTQVYGNGDKQVTIDLNGYVLKSTASTVAQYTDITSEIRTDVLATVYVSKDYTLTIKDSQNDGSVRSEVNARPAIYIEEDAVVNLDNGCYIVDPKDSGEGTTSKPVVNAGTVNVTPSVIHSADDFSDVIDNQNSMVIAVAKIGTTRYETIEAAITAANNATSATTITLLKDVAYANYGSGLWNVTKSVTIDGDGHSMSGWGSRSSNKTTLAINNGGTTMVDVVLKNLTINNAGAAGRPIETRGNINSLTLDNVTVNATGSGNNQGITIGGSQASNATLIIENSTINAGAAGYPVITFNPMTLNAENSHFTGYCGVYFKAPSGSIGSFGSILNADSCKFDAPNAYNGTNNGFGVFVMCTDDIKLNLNNCKINAEHTGTATQTVFQEDSYIETETVANVYTVTGEDTVINGDIFDETYSYNFGTRVWNIKAGTYKEDPSAYLASGYSVQDNGNGTYTVVASEAGTTRSFGEWK